MHYVALGIRETWVLWEIESFFMPDLQGFYLDSHSEETNQITAFATSMIRALGLYNKCFHYTSTQK